MSQTPYPLAHAIERGDLTEVRRLLAAGEDPNLHDPASGKTPLMLAARRGRLEILRELLAVGADPNARDAEDRWYPMLSAVGAQAAEVVEELLEGGASPKRLGGEMRLTPLRVAIMNKNIQIAQALIRAGADLEGADSGPPEPLLAAVVENDIEMILLLLATGAPVEGRNPKDRPNPENWEGIPTPLGTAAAFGYAEVIRTLLDAGANPNGCFGLRPLIDAAEDNSIVGTQMLLEAGADPTAKDAAGRTALDVAREKSYEELAQILTRAMRQR